MAKRTSLDIQKEKLENIYAEQAKAENIADISKKQATLNKLAAEELKILQAITNLQEKQERSLDSITRKLQDQIKELKSKEDLTEDENDLLTKSVKLQEKIKAAIKSGTGEVENLKEEYDNVVSSLQDILKLQTQAERSAKNFLGDVTSAISKVPLIGGALSKGFETLMDSSYGRNIQKKLAEKLFDPDAIKKSKSMILLGSAAAAALGTGFSLMLKRSEVMKDIRRGLGLTGSESERFRSMSLDMLSDSNSMATSQQEILESASQLSNVYGTLVQSNRQLVNSQITLTKGFGLQAEEAEKINMLADVTGQSYESQLKSSVATAIATGKVYKFSFNTNKILAEVARLSASIQASFKGSVSSMTRAVIQTKLMGTSLTQLDSVADNLLQIESSIENQVTAQLVTGRNINLERARLLALNNDLVGVGQELINQGIDYNTFSKMNRVEMQATAAAMGMQKDEFADMLLKQEVYRRAGADIRATDLASLKANEAKVAFLAKQGDAQAQQYIDSQKQLSMQERMTAAMENFSAVLENVYYIFMGIGVAMAALTFGASLIPALGAGILGGVASKQIQRVQDGIAPASNGPFTISDRKGNIAVTSAGDGIIATPNSISNSSNDVVNLLRQILTKIDQPAVIRMGDTTINELGSKTTLNRNYQATI